MEFTTVINERRSCRKFTSKEMPEEVLMEILDAGRLAPSGGNGQNHIFGVIRDEEQKRRLAAAAGKQMWIATAPVIIAYCAYISYDLKDVPDDNFALIVNKIRFGEDLVDYLNQYPNRREMGIFWNNASPLLPGQQIFLAAVNRGLRACWIGYLDVQAASEILDLPEDYTCLFLMPVGYPKEPPPPISRKSLEEIVFYERWE
jgi:nitroreductase